MLDKLFTHLSPCGGGVTVTITPNTPRYLRNLYTGNTNTSFGVVVSFSHSHEKGYSGICGVSFRVNSITLTILLKLIHWNHWHFQKTLKTNNTINNLIIMSKNTFLNQWIKRGLSGPAPDDDDPLGPQYHGIKDAVIQRVITERELGAHLAQGFIYVDQLQGGSVVVQTTIKAADIEALVVEKLAVEVKDQVQLATEQLMKQVLNAVDVKSSSQDPIIPSQVRTV
jgi:hypothetical protein